MRIDWTESASDDLQAMVRRVAKGGIVNAFELDDRVNDHVNLLADFPEMGRAGEVRGTRELVMPYDRCVVVYRVQVESIEIVRVFHGGQERPKHL